MSSANSFIIVGMVIIACMNLVLAAILTGFADEILPVLSRLSKKVGGLFRFAAACRRNRGLIRVQEKSLKELRRQLHAGIDGKFAENCPPASLCRDVIEEANYALWCRHTKTIGKLCSDLEIYAEALEQNGARVESIPLARNVVREAKNWMSLVNTAFDMHQRPWLYPAEQREMFALAAKSSR